MRLRRSVTILGGALCVGAVATALTSAATIRIAANNPWVGKNAFPNVPNPPYNFTTPSFGSDCASALSSQCENDYVYSLDAARHRMGLGSYRLPADFTRLPPTHQLFILMNLDRIAYGVKPVTGLIAALDTTTAKYMYLDEDPQPPPWFRTIGSAEVWASDYPNAPAAYFGWLYDDGPGSTNLDCPQPTSPGCWGHRKALFFQPTYSAVGASVGTDERGGQAYAMDVAGLMRPSRRYVYTWVDARRDGAGTNIYTVATP